jgi:hypothetical protein
MATRAPWFRLVVSVTNMMHLTFSDKSLLVGDEIARLVIEYAAALATAGRADTVEIVAYGADGDKVKALLLLDEGAPLMGESTHSDLPEPDNSEATDYVREHLNLLTSPPVVGPTDDADTHVEGDFESAFG